MSDDTPKKKGGRALTGTVVKTRDGRWQGQVTLPNGSRKRLSPPFPKGTSEAMAREKTAYWAAQYATLPMAPAVEPSKAELPDTPMGKWVKAWLADRDARKLSSNRDNRSHYLLHIAPSTGGKHVKDWQRDDMRKLSRDLDAKVQGKELAWKSAQNVWATATKMADDAAESKQDTLRCRPDNPAKDVRGPDRGEEVGEQFLYPSEFLKFVECPDVPKKWKQVVSLAVYLYPRDAEIRAMLCRDIDVEHRVMRITKALNRRTGEVKDTKGKRARTVPLEPAILPLLEVALEGRPAGAPLVSDMPSERDMARGLRRWLAKAGVDRHELHHRTPTTRPIRFHDLRATGITWMAVRGDDPQKIQYRAGHTDFETTQRYIRMAEAVQGGFGEPFPELPDFDPPRAIALSDRTRFTKWQDLSSIQRGGRDSNTGPDRNQRKRPRIKSPWRARPWVMSRLSP